MTRTTAATVQPTPELNLRRPQRISATIPEQVWVELNRRAGEEGRSVSNLVAYLLECALFPSRAGVPFLSKRRDG